LGGMPLGVGAVMMVVIWWIWAVRKGQIRERKSGHSPGGVATGMGWLGLFRLWGIVRTEKKSGPLTGQCRNGDSQNEGGESHSLRV